MTWIREIVGWLLLIAGIWLFYLAYHLLYNTPYVIQSAPMLIMGVIVFRGGIHFLKISMAARICGRAPEEQRIQPRGHRPSRDQGRRDRIVPGRN